MLRRIVKQSNPIENVFASISNLIRILNVKVSDSALKQIESHFDYPSLSSISDLLNEWRIENITITSSISQLKEIPYPAIAHLHKNGGHFIILQGISENILQYIDPEIGIVRESIEEFEHKWTGVVLLVETTAESGEENFAESRIREMVQKVSLFIVLGLCVVLLLLPVPFFSGSLSLVYALKGIGAVLSFFLLQKQLGNSSLAIDSFCKIGTKSDCSEVIHSPAAKIFGHISLSEIGVWYFFGGFLSIAIGALSSVSVTMLLLSLAILPLLFSLFAVYYQGWIIKKWCPLCLVILIVVWLESIACLSFVQFSPVGVKAFGVVFIGFSTPLIFWLSVRQRFMDSFKVPKLERSLNRFLKNEKIFQKVLETQPSIDIGSFPIEIQIGVNGAPIVLTVATNPDCGPCVNAHAVIEDLIKHFEGRLKVVFRFAISSKDTESKPYKVVSHLIELKSSGSNEDVYRALSSWYLKDGKTDIEKWRRENPIGVVPNPGTVHPIIAQHAGWCAKVGITATPTILINGQKLPVEFSVNDLKYQIRKLLEHVT